MAASLVCPILSHLGSGLTPLLLARPAQCTEDTCDTGTHWWAHNLHTGAPPPPHFQEKVPYTHSILGKDALPTARRCAPKHVPRYWDSHLRFLALKSQGRTHNGNTELTISHSVAALMHRQMWASLE